jgi:hypothetical protein
MLMLICKLDQVASCEDLQICIHFVAHKQTQVSNYCEVSQLMESSLLIIGVGCKLNFTLTC